MSEIDLVSAAFVAAQGTTDEATAIIQVARKIYPLKKGKHGDTFGNFISKICFGASECWFWYGATDDAGYGITHGPENKAHRLAWRLFNGPIPEGLKVCHKCDVRNCVNPDHLFLGTQKDNVRDMFAKGRANPGGAKGELNGQSKLTDSMVAELRQYRNSSGMSYRNLGIKFGISTMTAYRACVGQSWRHL